MGQLKIVLLELVRLAQLIILGCLSLASIRGGSLELFELGRELGVEVLLVLALVESVEVH